MSCGEPCLEGGCVYRRKEEVTRDLFYKADAKISPPFIGFTWLSSSRTFHCNTR